VGGFDLLFTGALHKSIQFTAETLLEFDETNQPLIDLERLHLRWKHDSGFWIEAGRTHTALGYWNLAYHHGKWLQTTIERPRVVAFEDNGGLLPNHWIGVQAGYVAKLSSDAQLSLSAAVGNARGTNTDDIPNAEDKYAPKQGYANLEVKGIGARDLRIGVSGVYGHIARQTASVRPALADVGINEIIANAYVAHASLPLTLIAEGYVIRHSGGGQSWSTYDAFAVIGYTFGLFTPYVKVERLIGTGARDPFFFPDPNALSLPTRDVTDGIVGLRADVSQWSAVKTEYRIDYVADASLTRHTLYTSWQFGL
jgi:hypothetical protein